MDRYAVALVLEEIGTLLDLLGDNRFKARAFASAARAVERADLEPAELVRTGALEELRGVGPGTAGVVRELVETGGSSYHRELRERTPPGLKALLAVPGLGPRRIHTLHEALGIGSVAALEAAAREGRLAALPGFGERTQARLVTAVEFVRSGAGSRRLPQALSAAERVLGAVRGVPGVQRAELGGDVRRRCETAPGVEVVAAATADACGAVLEEAARLPALVGAQRAEAGRLEGRLADGFGVDIRCVPRAAFAGAWLAATGSDAHLVELGALAAAAGLLLDGSGLHRGEALLDTPDEAAIYTALGLPWVPPELREGRGEVAAGAAGTLPRLVEASDLRGTFHCHTSHSDGTATVAEMAEAALARGWRYLGIADHSPLAGYAGGLSPAAVGRQHAEVDAWNHAHGHDLWVFKGTEADIAADGTVDYAGDPVMERFDYVVASVHSGFRMGQKAMTERFIRALSNPRVTFLGHLTGRLLLSREGYEVDVPAVVAEAAARGVGIEINADPHRLDLDWRYWPMAREAGVRCAINPDAHSVAGLDNVGWGVAMARKGWLAAADVINTWELDAVRAHFAARGG